MISLKITICFLLLLVCVNSGNATEKKYKFDDFEAHANKVYNSLDDLENKIDDKLIKDFDGYISEIKAIDIIPKEMLFYRLKLMNSIVDAKNKKTKGIYCKQYSSMLKYELGIEEKLTILDRKALQLFFDKNKMFSGDDNILRESLIEYVVRLRLFYGFKDPDSIIIKLSKKSPKILNDGTVLTVGYGMFNAKNSFGAYAGYRPFKIEYKENGEVVDFKILDDENTFDSDVAKLCRM